MAEARGDDNCKDNEKEHLKLITANEESISVTTPLKGNEKERLKLITANEESISVTTPLRDQEEENGSGPPDKETVTSNGQLRRGDAVSFRRKIGPFKYKHHGIVEKIIPDTSRFRIIHVTGTSKDLISSISSNVNTGICSEVIDFTKETDVFKYNFEKSRNDSHNPAAVAEMFLDYGLPKELGFHLLHFNCESFSRYCATGVVYSKQTNHVNEEAQIKLDEIVFKNGGNYR